MGRKAQQNERVRLKPNLQPRNLLALGNSRLCRILPNLKRIQERRNLLRVKLCLLLKSKWMRVSFP